MENQRNRQLYFNDCQQEAMYTAANTEVLIAGRRFGKTHGIRAPRLLRNLQAMPGSSGGIVGATFQQILTRTLPGTLNALRQFGYKRDVHYVIGRRPPKSLGFAKPVIEPVSFDHVMSWYNGSIQYFISQDVKGSSNSLTLDYLDIDEAKFINFEQLKDETLPANGGITTYFGHCPWHHGITITSDMPQSKKGSWFLSYKDKMDEELIAAIQAMVVEVYRLKQLPKTGYTERTIREYEGELARLRRIAVYYRELSSIENIQVLGEAYIRQMKRNLPPLVFQTSILCQRIGKLKSGFYPSLTEEAHGYKAFNNSFLQNLNYDFKAAASLDCRQDGDLDLKKPLCIAFDFNANINWLVVGQQEGLKLKVLKSFYVKYDRKLRELVDDFCRYYSRHCREVFFYYDSTALGSNYAVNDDDFAAVICDQLAKHRWNVTRCYMGSPLKHSEKYSLIDQGFKGQRYLLPQLNLDQNEALWLALTHTDVTVGSKGFQKDKSGEKYAESEEDLLEHRTDGTDAFDTLFIGMCLYPQASSGIPLGSAM